MPSTDMARLSDEIGAAEAMEWLTQAKRVRIDAPVVDAGWGARMAALVEEFEPLLEGRFIVMLGDESLLGDDKAEYVICFDEDADRDRIGQRYFLKV